VDPFPIQHPDSAGNVTPARWWQTGLIYQIYPRSFVDSDGDGVGDLRGIVGRLDYLVELGVDAIWLSPIYPSPMADFGYDITDHCDVEPLFGTLGDLDDLVARAHERGIRVILDLVPNHTSSEHPWFVDARSSRESRHRDWYIWRDPLPDGSPPNNWESYFGGSAWWWDEPSGQFYLHLFHRTQPDLNWRNPQVKAAIHDVMRFWFDRGIDGFRIDVLWLLVKDDEFRDNPPPPPLQEGEHEWSRYDRPAFEDRPEVQEIARELRRVADEYDDRVLIGEIYLPLERLIPYYGEGLQGIHLPFNFGLVTTPRWDASAIRQMIDTYEAALPPGAWPNWVLGNHDVPRIATRVGAEGARLAQMLLLTLRGTPTCYYGDEIGMRDAPIPPDRVVDPQARAGRSRDPARTPMQWDGTPTAGFTPAGVTPWLPIGNDAAECNVAAQAADPRSALSLFRHLVQLRRRLPSMTLGSYRSLPVPDDEVLAYLRQHEDGRVLVALNFGSAARRLDLSQAGSEGTLLCSTGMDRAGTVNLARLQLGALEGVVVRLEEGR
jgi:alpha-glucosidase